MDERRLVIARYDDSRNIWVVLPSVVDPVSNTISARTNHFSLFQVVYMTPLDAEFEVKAYPNPFRPSRRSVMTFATSIGDCRIRIYAYTGELIRDFSTDSSGIAGWDGRNDSGEEVGSGIYYVFAEGGGHSKTFRIAVQR